MTTSTFRGHTIVYIDGEWLYEDTMTPTVGNRRVCGHCEKASTLEGHDGCIGTLDNVKNACCGHGIIDEAYIQRWNGKCIRGQAALDEMRKDEIRN